MNSDRYRSQIPCSGAQKCVINFVCCFTDLRFVNSVRYCNSSFWFV